MTEFIIHQPPFVIAFGSAKPHLQDDERRKDWNDDLT